MSALQALHYTSWQVGLDLATEKAANRQSKITKVASAIGRRMK